MLEVVEVLVAISYDDLINGAVDKVKSLLDEGAVVLMPPGSFRGEIVGRLQDVGVVAYRKFHEGVEVMSIEGGRLLVGGKSLVEYIKGEGRLSESLRGWVIVPRSTIDALLVRQRLYEELVKELGDRKAAEELVKKRVKFYFPPKDYSEQLDYVKNLRKDLRKAVEVDYSDILGKYVEDARGISLKLVKAVKEGRADHVKTGVEAIRGLDPGVVGLLDLLKSVGQEVLRTLSTSSFVALVSDFGGAVVAPVILAVLKAFSLSDVKEVLRDFLNKLSKLAQDLGIESLNDLGVSIAERIFEWFTKRGKPRDEMLASIARLIKAVVAAKRYIDDDTFETVVDEVAAKWGLTYDAFRLFVDNLYKLATEKLVTEEELERLRTLSDEEFKKRIEGLVDERWEKFRKEVEDRLDKIEERLKELKKEVERQRGELRRAGILLGVYERPEDLDFDLEKKTFMNGRYTLVTSGRFEEYSSEILDRISRGEFVILVGPKGVGKSVLARYSLAKALDTGYYVVYEVQRVDEENLERVFKLMFGKWPVVLYDPSAPKYYERRREDEEDVPEIKETKNTAIKLIWAYRWWKDGGVNTSVVVVLPDDVFNTIREEIEKKAKEERVKLESLKVDLRQVDFLTDIVKAYSGNACGEEVYKRLGEYIAKNYAGGYTLVAKYAGEWLKQTKCAAEVEDAVKAGGGSAEAFVAQYIYVNVFKMSTDLVKKLAIPLVVRAELGPMPPMWFEESPALKDSQLVCRGNPLKGLTDPEKEIVKSWLSQEHEDLVEGVIRGIARGELSKRLWSLVEEAKSRGVEQTVSTAIVESVKEMEETIRKVQKRLEKADVEEKCKGRDPVEIFFKALANNDEFREAVGQCREDFAMAVGFAHTPYLLPRELLECQREGEPLLAGWLISGKAMPPATKLFLRRMAEAFENVVNPCEVINKLFEDTSRNGGTGLRNDALTLGAFAVSKDALRDCLEKAVALLSLALHRALVYVSLLKAKFVKFVENLVENSLIREAAKLIEKVESRSPPLAYDLLDIVREKVERGEVDLSRDWVTQALYEEASYLVYFSLPGRTDELKEWALRVKPLVRRECSDVPCLYTKALLGARLAEVLRMLGDASQTRDIINEAIRAVEELEKREGLASELEPLLKIRAPFEKPEEVVGEHLADLKKLVYGVAHRVYLDFDFVKALEYVERSYKIAESGGLGDATLNTLRGMMARVLFLMGQEGEAIQLFRECMKNMEDKLYVGYHDENISAITANYIASFLAEERVDEAVEEYRRHRDDVGRRPEYLLLLTGLLRVYGLDVTDEEVELKRRAYMVLVSRGEPGPRGVVAALAHRYGLTEERCEYGYLTAEDRAICETLLEIVERPNVRPAILRRWLVEQGLVEETLVEGVEDPVEMLEIVVSTVDSVPSLIEIMHLISRDRIEAARRLAEHWQKELSERGLVVPAVLFGELASSLREGKCGERCRKALLKLFYLHV